MSSTWFKKRMGTVIMLTGITTMVWADFYVIPINKKVEHVILVAKKRGDFTDIKAAMDSITDANETNRYLVYVGPGVYTVTTPIQLKPWVTLKGSGENATLLKSAVSSSVNTIIIGSDNAAITELSIENLGGGNDSTGIYNDSASPIINHIKVTSTGGNDNNRGIFNTGNSAPALTNVTATAFGGSSNAGIVNVNSSPTMNNVTASASGGSQHNHGISNHESSPTMTNVTATASGGTYAYGIANLSYSSPLMKYVTAIAKDGADSLGISNYDNASPIMYYVTATASGGSHSTNGILNNNAFPTIYHSTAKGSTGAIVGIEGSTPTCYYTLGIVGNTYKELNASCQ